MRLEGHVAVVTGGTGGLGRAVASAFLAAGARVIATTRNPVDGETHERLTIEAVDLVDEASMLAFADRVRERHGRCDHLVCCAGGFAAGTPVAEMSLDVWRRQLDLNATSAFLAARALLPLMLEARRGSIVLVGSRAALQPFAGAVPYSVSKAAVIALTGALAVELRDKGVTVNCVLPSVIDTPANRAGSPDADYTRWVTPEDLAETMLWLCSSAARETSGAVIPVYGRA
ncbi:MAG TPA: SDR family NAD(P)-dependent oxidoreductase [Gaiellales bacterium]|jgi:NAD(P)-dependent dehydrogenase (short-subunit alcohol dehydrogenase family)